jgi:hypothetical protein
LVGENDQPIDPGPEEELDDFWHTSVGKFRFSLEELPQHLQLIHELLKVRRILINLLLCTLNLQWYILGPFVHVTVESMLSRIEELIRKGPAYKRPLKASSSNNIYHIK